MTAVDRDPVTLAREVLGDERAWAALDPGHHPEGQAAVYRLANAAPTLARTVIDLTAQLDAERFAHANAAVKIKRVEDLVGRLEHEAAYEASRGDTWDATCIRAEARRIRRALNGDDQ